MPHGPKDGFGMNLLSKNLRKINAINGTQGSIEKGQSLLEMMFGMAVIVFILSGIIDLGRAFFTYIALEDAAGEAALYVSAYPKCPYDGTDFSGGTGTPLAAATGADDTTPSSCEPPDNAIWRAMNSGGQSGLVNWSDSTNLSWTLVCYNQSDGALEDGTGSCGSAETDDTVKVTITYKVPLLSPVIPSIAGAPRLALTGTSSATLTSPTN
jgi:Flp pilus assembly protein TadG